MKKNLMALICGLCAFGLTGCGCSLATMGRALENTIMGIGTVFLILFLICIVISLFNYIPKPDTSTKKSAEPVMESVAVVEDETDDLELVAVIAAAIAASTGASTDDFVVRSIRRRK